MKTAKGTKQLKLDPSIYESLQKERVEIGDVTYIEANSGAVKRQGRSDTFATEFDLEVSYRSFERLIFSIFQLSGQSKPSMTFEFLG